jgi:hypothetical protein
MRTAIGIDEMAQRLMYGMVENMSRGPEREAGASLKIAAAKMVPSRESRLQLAAKAP